MDERTAIRLVRATGTHADVFAAVGLADLVSPAFAGGVVRLVGESAHFLIDLPEALGYEHVARIPQTPGYPFLKANEKVVVPVVAVDPVDYKAEKAKADRKKQAYAQRQGARKTADPEIQELVQQDQLRDDWRLLQVLNALQGDETSNRVHETVLSLTAEEFRNELAEALEAASSGRHSGLNWKVSTVQLFAPIAAKGYSRLKPDGTDRNDKTKELWADPFVEWLRYRGYFRVACPFFQGSKGEHVRLLCPVPHDISLHALEFVARKLRGVGLYGGPPKMDALAVLKLAELLVVHSEEYHEPQIEVAPGLFLEGKTPAKAISGLMVTDYQSLGNAKAVSAMFTMALPDWFPIRNKEDALTWLAILDEHQRVIRGLQDDHSDEIGLLVAYRRFLEKRAEGAIWALIEFMEHYGSFLIRAREQKRKVRAFRTDYFRRVIMQGAPRFKEVLENAGFQAVAAAVRKATVSAQAQKAMKSRDYREIRYDLLHDLRRKRGLPGSQPLMEAVSDFISKYNAENYRRWEMGKSHPRNVTTEEFLAFAAVVDDCGASVVGALLCAYGSCREPREEEQALEEDNGSDQAETSAG